MIRAKFVLSEETRVNWNSDARKLVFSAQYDQNTPEDQRYSKATPTGRLEMQVDNPAALEQFQLGKAYYIDFTPVES